MNEDQRLEYQSLLKSITQQVEAMEDPADDEEMLYDRVDALAEQVEELRDLIDSVYG